MYMEKYPTETRIKKKDIHQGVKVMERNNTIKVNILNFLLFIIDIVTQQKTRLQKVSAKRVTPSISIEMCRVKTLIVQAKTLEQSDYRSYSHTT